MANKVLLKKSSVGAKVPLTTDLDYGELALNYADGKLYYKTSGVTIDSFPSATATSTLTNKTLTSPTLNGTTTLAGSEVLITAGSGGNEGGELHFQTPPTGSTLSGPIAIDIYQNKLRIFETAGTNRGVYIDLTAASASVATNLLGGTGTVTSITAGTGLTGGTITTSGTIAIDTTVVTTLTGVQTLTNKTLSSATLTGTLTAGASTGTNGQVLQSTGTGVQWATISTPSTTYSAQAEFGVTGISTSTTVYSFATATYRSAKYFITITNGTNYGTYEFMVSHDGTIVYLSGNNNDYVISGTSVNYFSGDYVEEVLDLNTRIEIGTMGHSLNWTISAGSLVFSAASTTGTISVKGFVTLIKV